MWFKNMQCFTFSGLKTPEDWQEALSQLVLVNPTGARDSSIGWVSPFGLTSECLYHQYGHFVLLKIGMLQRMLPASVIKQAVDEQIALIKNEQDRNPSAKEKAKIKDQIRFELMPRAFCRRKEAFILINTHANWMVADSANHDFAEQAIALLHETIGSFPTQRVRKDGLSGMMTNWLRSNEVEKGYTLDQDCQLINSQDKRNTVRISCQDLDSNEVSVHLQAGKQVVKLGLNWSGHLSFVLDDQLNIARIKHLDIEADHENNELTAEEKFDADFALLAPYYHKFVEGLFDLLNLQTETIKKETAEALGD